MFYRAHRAADSVDRMPTVASTTDVSIYYETIGSSDDPPLVLIPGLGSQLLLFPEEFCQGLVDRGLCVTRMDNRDAGLSTLLKGAPVDGSAYSLSDMAADVVAVIDAVANEPAHVVGMSMGGMIAQTVALEHPGKCQSLTSLSSSTGNFAVAVPSDEVVAALNSPSRAANIEERIEEDLASRRLWASPNWQDDDACRVYFRASYERSPDQTAVEQDRQMAAIRAAGSRDTVLAQITVPTLVLHGLEDTLIPPAAGEHAAALIPGAELVMIDDMGHDLPIQAWAAIINAITVLAARSYES